MSSAYQLWRFENAVPRATTAPGGYDALFVPRLAYTTGDIDAHDIALDHHSRPVFINTLFSCIAAPSETHSFRVLGKPPFITKLAAEDRCHLNGLAIRDGAPAFVTAVGTTDVHEGWREKRHDGGVFIDVHTNEIISRGLSTCRENRTFSGLLIVDLRTGDIAHSLTITGIVRELYDVAILPGTTMPCALGFKTEEIHRTITIDN